MRWCILESPVVELKYVFPRIKAENDLSPTALIAGIKSNSFPRVEISPDSFLREQARSRGRAPPDIFRFDLNSASKVPSILDQSKIMHVLLLFCAIWNCVKERNRIFALPKTTHSFKVPTTCTYDISLPPCQATDI